VKWQAHNIGFFNSNGVKIMAGKMVERTCKCGCGVKFMARVADVKRGWGKYASKSCKAKAQEKRTGQYTNYLRGIDDRNNRDDKEFSVSHGIGGQSGSSLQGW